MTHRMVDALEHRTHRATSDRGDPVEQWHWHQVLHHCPSSVDWNCIQLTPPTLPGLWQTKYEFSFLIPFVRFSG
jgi:hypothetical protein